MSHNSLALLASRRLTANAHFKITSDYSLHGDQPQAVDQLVGRPTLVIAHNKTLAAQLCDIPASRVPAF